MKAPTIAAAAIAATFAFSADSAVAAENVFVRSKNKFLEVTERPKDVVKGVGKDIGFGFRDAWKRVSSFVTGKEPEPEFPVYDPGPYTPPPYGYTSPQGTNYAPGYGPPIPYPQQQPQTRYTPNPAPTTPSPQPSNRSNPALVPPPQKQPTAPTKVTKPQPAPKKTTPPKSAPKQKTEPKKTVTPPVTPPSKPETKPVPKKPEAPAVVDDRPPFATPIPGKNGMVYSPFTKDNKPVDVRDIPSGTVVKDPYTNKLFRVP